MQVGNREAIPWCRIRSLAQAMDRRTDIRLDQLQSPLGARLRTLCHDRHCLHPPRHDPHHAKATCCKRFVMNPIFSDGLLAQDTILENLILTGLRGVGKTVLAESFKPIAIQEKWVWVGTDLSEAISVSESNLAIRIITDLSVFASALTLTSGEKQAAGFSGQQEPILHPVNFAYLNKIFEETPGLTSDKLKAVLEFVWSLVRQTDRKGVIFAHDEAQTLADNAQKDQYPLSVLLDVFQSIQRRGIPFMLALVGLPTLFPKLVEARAYAERMFRVVELSRLDDDERREAIRKPVESA